MPSSSQSFNNLANGDLTFTNVGAVENDFAPNASDIRQFTNYVSTAFTGISNGSNPAYVGAQWGNFFAGAFGDQSNFNAEVKQTVTFNSTVSVAPGGIILGYAGLVVANRVFVAGGTASLTAVETLTNAANGNTLGTSAWSYTAGSLGGSLAPASSVNVSIAVTADITGGGDANSANNVASFSAVQQTFIAGSVAIDKQVSIDGGNTWLDRGNGNLADNTTTTVGAAVKFRVIVTNTSTSGVVLNNASLSDVNAAGNAAVFTFANQSSFSGLAAGASITSDVSGIAAQQGVNITDTATLSGTVSVTGGPSGTVTGSDVADYSATITPTPSLTLDKQVSVNCGATWQDVGNGVLQNPSATTGGSVEYRVVVTDAGTTGLNNISVSDVGGGPVTGFSFAGATTLAALAVGQSVTSDIATAPALGCYVVDTANATGTVTGGTATVTASDKADYTGVAGDIIIDKQDSLNGCTWYDVGSGVLQDPTAGIGGKIYYRAIVTDTGSHAITNVKITDVGAGAPTFTFNGGATSASLGAGQSITTDVVGATALAGYNTDTATVTGTVVIPGTVSGSGWGYTPGGWGWNGCGWSYSCGGWAWNPGTLSGGSTYGTSACDVADYTGKAGGAISTYVFNYCNGSVTADPGITVNLLTGNGAATGISTITNSSGIAVFGNLAPGNYEVAVVTPVGATVVATQNINTSLAVTSGNTINAAEALSPPPPTLWGQYGQAKQIEFCYKPSDAVSGSGLTAGLGSCSGHDAYSNAFVEISNSANPYQSGAKVYFAGNVTSGQEIYANASNVAGGSFDQTTYIHVFSSQWAAAWHQQEIQTDTYATGGSGQNVHLGDQIGAVSVTGYVGAWGAHVV